MKGQIMKKVSTGILIACFLLLGAVTQVHAAYISLFDDPNKTTFGTTNRSSWDDAFSPTYKGYYDPSSPFAYSGYYLGTFAGNAGDPSETVQLTLFERLVRAYLGDSTLLIDNYWKVEASNGTTGPLTVASSDGGFTGTWSLSDPWEIGFYVVKASNEFALYYVHPFADSGTWSTKHLLTGSNGNNNNHNIPDISYLSVSATRETPIPEPATIFLMGAGLLGLAGYSRWKVKKS